MKKKTPKPVDPQVKEDPQRHPMRGRRPSSYFNDFKVDIPEYEGKLEPDKFLERMQTVERIFEYKEIP